MEVMPLNSSVIAFVRPEQGANVGLIHTPEGMILIDTTSSPRDIRALFKAANVSIDGVRLVVNTHFHEDHTWGNQLFGCPILAHRQCQEIMASKLGGEWSFDELQAYIEELEKTNPQKAEDTRSMVRELNIKLPDLIFDGLYEYELGGVKLKIIHLGGHTPDLAVVWLPEKGVLFASDLIFQGRYPYIFDSNVPGWIAALERLLEFEAETIIPGHGILCGKAEIMAVSDYLRQTWELTEKHVRMGHSEDETCLDPAFPYFAEGHYERLHQANIRFMYEQMKKIEAG